MAIKTSTKNTIGNGGVDYNTADTALKKQIAQNQSRIAGDANYKQNEIQRALQVIAQRQAQGLDTTDQQKYLTKNLGYTGSITNPSTNTNTNLTTPSAPSAPKTNTSQSSQSSELMDMMRQIATRETKPFSYDPNSDPAYQAALKRAQANIQEGNSAAQAEMNRRGILNSTITSDRMSEIASNEMGRVETEVLPSLMQQAYNQYLNELNQDNQRLANLGSIAQMYINEDQRGVDNTNTQAQLTGYLPGGEQAQNLVNQLASIKDQAEAPGITAAERTRLSNQADGIRAMLAQMGVDTSQYGANVNAATVRQLAPQIRTLAGQQLDQSRQGQAFDQQFAQEQFAYQRARDAISDQQWKAIFERDVNQFGLNYALQKLSEQNQQSYRQAQLALSRSDNARQNATTEFNRLMDIWQANNSAPAGIPGVTPGTPYGGVQTPATVRAEEYATSYLDKMARYDEDNNLVNQTDLQMAILQSGLPDSEIAKLYIRYGIPLPEGFSGN